jgi:hypothetical protein
MTEENKPSNESSYHSGQRVKMGDYLKIEEIPLKELEERGYFPTSFENRNSYIATVCKETKEVIRIRPDTSFPKHKKEFDEFVYSIPYKMNQPIEWRYTEGGGRTEAQYTYYPNTGGLKMEAILNGGTQIFKAWDLFKRVELSTSLCKTKYYSFPYEGPSEIHRLLARNDEFLFSDDWIILELRFAPHEFIELLNKLVPHVDNIIYTIEAK